MSSYYIETFLILALNKPVRIEQSCVVKYWHILRLTRLTLKQRITRMKRYSAPIKQNKWEHVFSL